MKLVISFQAPPKIMMRISTKTTKQLQRDFEYVFSRIGCFDGMLSLQVKPDSKPYQVPPRCVVDVLQKPFKEELD